MIVITDTKTPIVMGSPSTYIDFTFKGLPARYDGLKCILYWRDTATHYRHLKGEPLEAVERAQMQNVFDQLGLGPTQ